MFGYVVPCKHQLSDKDYNVFRAYYCRLCKELGTEVNHPARIGLSYDFTFLAILLSSLYEYKDNVKKEVCITNPFKRKSIIQANESIKYCANMNFIFTYFNYIDKWRDNKSINSLLAAFLFYLPLRKVRKNYYDKYNVTKQELYKLSILERERCDIIDEVADKFAKIVQEIFVPGFIQDEGKKRILGWMGYNIGRWIYVIDAIDDLEEDIKRNNYNPVLLQYQYNKGEALTEFKARIKGDMEMSLLLTAENISKSYELLDVKRNNKILENIIYQGLKNKTSLYLNETQSSRRCKNSERSIRGIGHKKRSKSRTDKRGI